MRSNTIIFNLPFSIFNYHIVQCLRTFFGFQFVQGQIEALLIQLPAQLHAFGSGKADIVQQIHLGETPLRGPVRRTLTLVPCKDGKFFYLDPAGNYWRTYLFVENVTTYEILDSTSLAEQLGRTVGEFQNRLASYKGPRLHDTIPRFHDMHLRYQQLDQAIASDPKGRVASVQAELAFLMQKRQRGMVLSDGLASGQLREGITHNDTKLNNILIDRDYICENAQEGDLVITLGCGDAYKIAKMIMTKLSKEEN